MADEYCTVETIVEKYKKERYTMEGWGEVECTGNTGDITSLYIRNKFKEILKEIDCPESVFRSRAKKQDGHFIFNGDDVPNTMREIIKFYSNYSAPHLGYISFGQNRENKFSVLSLFNVKSG